MDRSFFKSLEIIFQNEKNDCIAQKQSSYLRNLFPFFGITKPRVSKIANDFSKVIPFHSSILRHLWEQNEREYQYVAILLARKNIKSFQQEDITLLEKMIREKSWWDSVDDIAANLVGPHLVRFPKLLNQMDQWIEDSSFWIRRTALIFQLRYKEKTDHNRLFHFIETQMDEKEFFIRKAIGWALREYSKTNPNGVRNFVNKQRKNLSPLSIKEASKYL